jgi:hypothetical protein
MFWQSILSRAAGHSYGAAGIWHASVYGDLSQVTKAGDTLLVEVLRKDGSVLKSFEHTPGAWSGKSAFAAARFDYQGDGSGDVRLCVGTAVKKTSDCFTGATDNLIVKETK